MSLFDYVLEAKKSPTISAKAEIPKTGENNDDDMSTQVPDDPEVTPEENEGEAPEADAGDYTQGIPEDEGEGNDAGGDEDPSQNVPDPDGEDTGNEPAPADTGAGGGATINTGGGNEPQEDTQTPAQADDPSANVPSPDDEPADPNASPQPTDNPDGTTIQAGADTQPTPADPNQPATDTPDDFSQGMPEDDGTDTGADPGATPPTDPNATQQQPTDPNQQQDPNAPPGEGGDPNDPNADPAGDGTNEEMPDDGMGNANSFSDSADNGENPEQLTEIDKKNNIIILRHSYVKLYKEVSSFLEKLENARKDSLLSIVTYNQVKTNLTELKELLVSYISIYYDTNEYEINLFNYEYMIQIVRVNIKIINKMREGNKKLDYEKVSPDPKSKK